MVVVILYYSFTRCSHLGGNWIKEIQYFSVLFLRTGRQLQLSVSKTFKKETYPRRPALLNLPHDCLMVLWLNVSTYGAQLCVLFTACLSLF